MIDRQDLPFPERFFHLEAIMSGERFLKLKSKGHEIPFFVCPFNPKETDEMMDAVKQLEKGLAAKGIKTKTINIFDTCIEILKKRGRFDQILEKETQIEEKDQLLEMLQNTLDPEQHLVPEIARQIQGQDHQILFLTGVGAVFPIIRSHSILNNLQIYAKDKPTVMFFPGEFSHSKEKGASLDLFGTLNDDKYYRAFNIFDCEP